MTAPAVAILLATYNGARNLAEQLDSFAAQTHPPALVLVSDDGSTDATRDILARFATAHPALPLQVLEGPQQGSAANFLSLLARCPEDIDMACFSDQDDVWLENKIARAVAQLGNTDPQLYCARTWECDDDLSNRRISRLPPKPAGFRNALVQNIAAGNTIMLNRAALDLARTAAARTGEVAVHDWWVYQLMTGAGARVIFDPEAVLLYRQHAGNLIGANRGMLATLRRLRHLFTGTFRRWNDINIAALEVSAAHLTEENRALLRHFARARTQGPRARIAMLRKTGFYRQGRLGQASLWLAAMLGRL
ncbi:glycosyltransferase family 2 protein [Sulfitobacter sp. F26169L]|uniref:glycosyltransferase family 2 protein n=1 Tax=Sulfitobacter sp. F26169L TaxID=2996015 RepID=UPI002260EE7C|nr:glycosyltransferase family 2 protein [Sulfitobacter sp. F26169L]MCX7568025.1 glycosyltransferase family 2 protein [Sulfitobacter sp. F26169L]